ncbi:MAG: BrnA antitoxin family protein [Comamonas sp.]|nr:BrnA antitoxin family protein [Comamonas sp.]
MSDQTQALDPDTAQLLASLERGLSQAAAGQGHTHTPEQITARKRGRPVGSTQASTKEPVKLRLDADVLAALRATGDGWQTRINEMLRASLRLAGKV